MSDVVALLFDGIIYGYLLHYIVINAKRIGHTRIKSNELVHSISIGISDSGTAMRHRYKIYPLYLLVYALLSELKVNTLREKLKNIKN